MFLDTICVRDRAHVIWILFVLSLLNIFAFIIIHAEERRLTQSTFLSFRFVTC